MGVHGLWRLIEPSGKPVPLETLENKVLAVDVSIWLHHFIKGFQDSKGATVPNAHLLGIYHRICKLLYFRVKPVFVFDGGVPVLKKNTIALRNQRKKKNLTAADNIHKNLLSALIKHTAISKVLSEKAKAAIATSTSPKKLKSSEDDIYDLPPSQLDSTVSTDESSDAEDHSSRHFDLHSIDTQSVEFKSLPVDVRHEILTDLKETRKQSSWGRIHELPVESDDFSVYQMKRLLKRQSVQTALESVEKEMGGHSLSLGELEKILKDQGVISNMKGSRIASDENTRYLLIKDLKQTMEEAKKNLESIDEVEENQEDLKEQNKGETEFQDDLKRAIELSLEEGPSTSKPEEPSTSGNKIERKWKKKVPEMSFLADDFEFGSSESSEEEEIRTKLTPAQRYMMEYSGLTSHAIAKIIDSKSGVSKKLSWDEDKGTTTAQVESTTSSKVPQENEVKVTEKCETTTALDNQENIVTTSVESGHSSDVQLMSDSSSCDDFVDVDTSVKTTMEVLIKPDEEIEDDLFKDIFEDEKVDSSDVTSTQQDNVLESIEHLVSSSANEEKEKEKISNGKIEKEVTHVDVIDEKKQVINGGTPEEKPEAVADDGRSSSLSSKSTSQATVEKIQNMIKTYSKPKEKENTVSVEQLQEMKDNLRKEQSELAAERSTKERHAGNITDQMCQEAQELLELFGVPYLVAPMEAEAQCAFLDLIDLTDGTITDDSDVWLFGGQTVYKNFFNQKQLVMEFKSESIHQHYKLTREQMILLAMLVGSDYTTGITGVGPVTALEILAAFPPKNQLVSGLAEFKSWCTKGKTPGPGRNSLRGKLKNVSFTENFPNPKIAEAYLEPTVETSKEQFTWGKLDVPGLVDFAKRKFGWTQAKSEEILGPILKRLEDSRIQKSITDYFKRETKIRTDEPEKVMSKRVKNAVDRIAKGNAESDTEDAIKPKKRTRKKSSEPKPKKLKNQDEELRVLEETKARSKIRVEEIQKEIEEQVEKKEKKVDLRKLHRKEVIPQRQKDKTDLLKNKLKAIETFRKSKQGPGYVKKQKKSSRAAHKDASYLSEGSSSD